MYRRALLVTLAAVFVLAIAGCSTPVSLATTESLKPAKERKPAPDFSLKDADGRTVKLSDYLGQVVLLNFWATWCGPCRIEIPWFIEFEQRLKDQRFAVLGVSMDDDGWDAVRPYVEKHRINYRMVVGDENVSQLYGGVDALPTTFLIDREGKIASVHIGLVSKSAYQNDIDSLLGVNKSAASRRSPATGTN